MKPVESPDKNKRGFTLEELTQLDFKPQEYKIWLDGPIAPKGVGKVTKTILKMPPKDWKWGVTSAKACQ